MDGRGAVAAREFQKSPGSRVGLHNGGAVRRTAAGSSSNDSGDVSWVVPAGSLNFPSAVPGVGPHEWQAAVFPTSSISHKGQVAGAKALAASILDLLTSPALLQKAHAEFEASEEEALFLADSAGRQARCRHEPGDGEIPSRNEEFYLNKTPRFN